MNKLKFYIAMVAGKLTALGLRLLGRNASYLPGLIALKLCGNFIGCLQKPKTLICVTGTNGKTTTSNLIASALTQMGYKVTNNSFGSNVAAGVASALLENSTFGGRHKNDWAVIEVDERSSLRVYPYMAPDYIICNNIMRDSLKRNANTEFISFIINQAIPAETKLVLNADDIICSDLAPQCDKRVYFGVDAELPQCPEDGGAKDVCFCPKCGARLQPEYLRFQHIGRWKCTACDFTSHARDYCVTEIDRADGTFKVAHGNKTDEYTLVNDNIVNVFNLCGAVALLSEIGIPTEMIAAAFEGSALVRTRFEQVDKGNKHVTMILAKGQNPVAVSRVFSYVAKCPGENKCVLMIIDDKEDNINNSENTCWLYDLDYTPLKDSSVAQLIFAGKRRYDHVLRASMTGLDISKIITTDSVKDCSALVDVNKYDNIYVLYDNYFLDEARREEKLLLERMGTTDEN